MASIKIPLTSASSNYGQVVLMGAEAKIHSILLLLNTPIGSNQEDPTSGFDPDDFLFKTRNSEELSILRGKFINKCKEVTGDDNIDVSINFVVSDSDKNTAIEINILIEDDDGTPYGFTVKKEGGLAFVKAVTVI